MNCEQCNTKFTAKYFMRVDGPIIIRCRECRAKYRVETSNQIMIVSSFTRFIFLAGLMLSVPMFITFGITAYFATISLGTIAWLIAFVWIRQHIVRTGKFKRLGTLDIEHETLEEAAEQERKNQRKMKEKSQERLAEYLQQNEEDT